jgi:deoxyadenosine/deoxycytidine kinase
VILISISGNIAVGKSTLGPLLADALDAIFLPEPAAINPYLADYYRDPARWAFHSQVHFLTERVRQFHAQSSDSFLVVERSIGEDTGVFHPVLAEMGALSERESRTLGVLSSQLQQVIPNPDFFVVLEAPIHRLRQRVEARNEVGDSAVSDALLELLALRYRDWLENLGQGMVRIDTGGWSKSDVAAEAPAIARVVMRHISSS